MNTPYVKQYDENGSIINPIEGSYENVGPNRSERRKALRRARFFGNGKNTPLSVGPKYKYLRQRQVLFCKKTNKWKTVEHYIILN